MIQAEIFVYDRNLLTSKQNEEADNNIPEALIPQPFAPEDPPNSVLDETSLEAWQKLFRDRKAWATSLFQACDHMIRDARKNDEEAAVIQRATIIAVENIKQHVGNLHKKYDEANGWATGFLQEHEVLLDRYETVRQKLMSIPAVQDLKVYMEGTGFPKAKSIANADGFMLQDMIDMDVVEESASIATEALDHIAKCSSELTNSFEAIFLESSSLIDNFPHEFPPPANNVKESSNHLVEEVKVIVNKISSDYEANLSLENTPRSISIITKAASLHTRNFLPSLVETTWDVDRLARQAIEHRNKIVRTALTHMQKISLIESSLATTQPKLAVLDIDVEDGKAFDVINRVVNLPYLYGFLLIETIHRREWGDKMAADTSALAEEMAVFKEEEERRRVKWLKQMGDYINQDVVSGKALGVEVNIKAEGNSWPHVSREDLRRYLECLNSLGGFEETIKEMYGPMKGLDAPSKQQLRRSKGFKSGSIHETAFGRTSIINRGEDDLLRTLQSDKARLEDKLKGSESRVRKLEDILHRHSQMATYASGPVFGIANGPPIERQQTSPILPHTNSSPKFQDTHSRQSSVSSRRFSANNGLEEKKLAQRIVKLEAELTAERAKSSGLEAASGNEHEIEKDLRGRIQGLETALAKGSDLEAALSHQVQEMKTAAAGKLDLEVNLRNQIQEVTSTKKDLMGNFEAQQHEFDCERRLLEDELNKLKLRLEDAEDELDHVLGSRENERTSTDERINFLESELEKVKRDTAQEVQKVYGQTEFLKNDYTIQRERANQLEIQVQRREEEKVDLQAQIMRAKTQLHNRDELQLGHQKALQAAHLQLSDEEIPEEYDSLANAIETLAERSASHLRDLQQALDTVHTENATLESQLKKRQEEIDDLTNRLGKEETEVFNARENIAEQKLRFNALEEELEDERRELASLRSKFAAGETGVGALRSRIAEEERKVGDLSTNLAGAKKHIERLETELSDRTNDTLELQKKLGLASVDFEARGHRAEEVSSILFSQISRLSRLLEHLGFSVTKQDGGMILQRLSRASTGSTTLNDASQSMNRSISGHLSASAFEENSTSTHPHWVVNGDMDAESHAYDEFSKEIHSFRMDAFSEAIIKRVKEAEHTARKWQREAKSYRDKSHRAQVEAHEKIAFRAFKEGDLALFLPTRNNATKPWAAFNVGAPHYFLREQESHKLRTRDWLLARISKIQERIVDYSKPINGMQLPSDRNSIGEASDGGASFDDENPFELSDGLRWYMLDAAEEKPGAPTTPGLGKSTVASANVDAKGTSSLQRKRSTNDSAATKTLTKSLDSRRNSSNSKKSLVGAGASPVSKDVIQEGSDSQVQENVKDPNHPDEVRFDQLFGP